MTLATRAWAAEQLGVLVYPAGSLSGLQATDLVGVALRRNPKRVHLLVSTLLGKHVPTDPRLVRGSAHLLGRMAARWLGTGDDPAVLTLARLLGEALADPAAVPAFWAACRAELAEAQPVSPAPTVIGMCETAVALGYGVCEALPGSVYLATTRRVTDVPGITGFEEEHSHATSHLLCPADPGLLTDTADGDRPLVLVDDELSTGQTLLNTIEALHALAPRRRYLVLSYVDLRSHADARRVRELAERLDVEIEAIALAKGRVKLPDGLAEASARWRDEAQPGVVGPVGPVGPAEVTTVPVSLHRVDVDGPVCGRHGIDPTGRDVLAAAMTAAAERLAVDPAERVLVLGTEEFMAAPLLLATALTDGPARTIRYSTTTRSPAVPVDDPGYPLRTALVFAAPDPDPDETAAVRYAYNVTGGGWDRIVLVVDEAQAGPRLTEGDPRNGLPALVPLLSGCADRVDVLTVAARPGQAR